MKALTGSEYARICAAHNFPISKNKIGDSGENILGFAMSYFPVFNMYFLDGKAPIEDFFGEIADETNPYPFLIQVKTTEKGTDANGNLLATLPKNKREALVKRPVPTYLAAIDLHKIEVYLCPVFDPNIAYTTVPPTHVITFDDPDAWADIMDILRKDVIHFWEKHTDASSVKSNYKSML